jgi:hypothetical protein
MRALPTACLSVAFGLLSITTSSAQFADPRVALAGRDGAMTCGVFAHMSPHHRDAIVRGLNTSAPPRSLAPTSGTLGAVGPRGSGRTIIENSSTMPGSRLDAGVLVAACEAATPGESLRAAYGAFDSGRGVVIEHRYRR